MTAAASVVAQNLVKFQNHLFFGTPTPSLISVRDELLRSLKSISAVSIFDTYHPFYEIENRDKEGKVAVASSLQIQIANNAPVHLL